MKRQSFNENWLYEGNTISVPHDALIHEERRADAPCGSAGAFFPGRKFVYEKTFERPAEPHVIFQFEGVYKNAIVTINGKAAGGASYGYIPFFVRADGFLQDGTNTIRVECDCSNQPDSRWYSGAGIYRPVWMWTGPENSIEPESVRISTLSINPAVIRIQAETSVKATVEGITGEGTDFTLTIPDAKLWSETTPYLYTAHITNDHDECDVTFGIRKVEWTNKGLLINGRETLLRGGCVHHDNGILGAAAFDESEWRRVRILKEAGYNAIRSSHNPCSRAMLEACDALGMYMMDETWDMWFHHKTKHDYAGHWRTNHIADLEAMVNRDFNHPSVIMYSIGNEVSEPAKEEGISMIREMADYLHEHDPNRAVTGGFNLMIISSAKKGKGVYDENGEGRDESGDKAMSGMNSTMFNLIASFIGTGMNKAANSRKADEATSPALDLLDIAGYNYASGRYEKDGKLHPERVIFGSETFPSDIAKNWAMVEKYTYLIGDFMWTAWDYLGEAGIGAWAYTDDGKGFSKPYPWLLADTGAFDIIGTPNGEYYQAAAVWHKLDEPAITVQPINHDKKPIKAVWRGTNSINSWSWKDCEGKKAVIEVYYDCASVELFLNGSLIGKRKAKECKTTFKVPYKAGTLLAVAYDGLGREIGRSEIHSASNAHITVTPEKLTVKPGEIVYVPVMIADQNGITECNDDRQVCVSVENGELLAFGSANPRTEERFDEGIYKTYYGKALAVVRAGTSGSMKVNAQDNGEASDCVIEIM